MRENISQITKLQGRNYRGELSRVSHNLLSVMKKLSICKNFYVADIESLNVEQIEITLYILQIEIEIEITILLSLLLRM